MTTAITTFACSGRWLTTLGPSRGRPARSHSSISRRARSEAENPPRSFASGGVRAASQSHDGRALMPPTERRLDPSSVPFVLAADPSSRDVTMRDFDEAAFGYGRSSTTRPSISPGRSAGRLRRLRGRATRFPASAVQTAGPRAPHTRSARASYPPRTEDICSRSRRHHVANRVKAPADSRRNRGLDVLGGNPRVRRL